MKLFVPTPRKWQMSILPLKCCSLGVYRTRTTSNCTSNTVVQPTNVNTSHILHILIMYHQTFLWLLWLLYRTVVACQLTIAQLLPSPPQLTHFLVIPCACWPHWFQSHLPNYQSQSLILQMTVFRLLPHFPQMGVAPSSCVMFNSFPLLYLRVHNFVRFFFSSILSNNPLKILVSVWKLFHRTPLILIFSQVTLTINGIVKLSAHRYGVFLEDKPHKNMFSLFFFARRVIWIQVKVTQVNVEWFNELTYNEKKGCVQNQALHPLKNKTKLDMMIRRCYHSSLSRLSCTFTWKSDLQQEYFSLFDIDTNKGLVPSNISLPHDMSSGITF